MNEIQTGTQLVKARYGGVGGSGCGWKCNKCFYSSGSSEGPPNYKCNNCGQYLYYDIYCDEFDTAHSTLIFIYKTNISLGFRLLCDFKSQRMVRHEDAKFYRNKIEELEKEVRILRKK